MADKISFEPPRGMRDFYPEDMAWRNRVFDAFRAAGEAAGFRQLPGVSVVKGVVFRDNA
jgi:histidyl-tRNA synthetase